MAYGQTGSGKTYTMGSDDQHFDLSGTLSSTMGLIPRFVHDLFRLLDNKKNVSDHATTTGDSNTTSPSIIQYDLQASFLEVYGEDVHDLLDGRHGRSQNSLPLREDAQGGIIVCGLTSRSVRTATEALSTLRDGTHNRTTAATLMNLTSSRSHAVYTIILSQTRLESDASEITCTSRFTFVDLAGSERMKKTGAEGERAREGIKINEGLLALGNVINALADDERLVSGLKVHVPYRQSKLTRLLQDALGGNSRTLFLACVSPADTNASETMSTLRYANRARNIRNALVRNIDPRVLELQRLTSWNRLLCTELVKYKFGFQSKSGDVDEDHIHIGEEMGSVDDALMLRPDVVAYLQQIQSCANESTALPPHSTMIPWNSLPASSQSLDDYNILKTIHKDKVSLSSLAHPFEQTDIRLESESHQKATGDDFDPSMLADVSPDQELAILDQLLELHNAEQQFDKAVKEEDNQIENVEVELAQQEALLLQLRDSLKIYHSMKQKYEQLMTEVQQLEREKSQLADQLEKSHMDPSLGCSISIKRELEHVERSLARARIETRKHRQMCRKAEQEAQKCGVLERKIADLKTGRAVLMKKQQEAAAKHRLFTESKSREIFSLKKKELCTSRSMMKLQSEVQKQKKQLEKRHEYCQKLSAKLKQTESHLMSLLSKRQRELHDRTSIIYGNRRRPSTLALVPSSLEKFAPDSEEVQILRYMLEQGVRHKVNLAESNRLYEEKINEHNIAMQELGNLLKELATEKIESQSSPRNRELKLLLEDCELKVDLIGSDLDELRSQLSSSEIVGKASDDQAIAKLVESENAPVLRTVLLAFLESYAQSEVSVLINISSFKSVC
jgi:hypothetical protein